MTKIALIRKNISNQGSKPEIKEQNSYPAYNLESFKDDSTDFLYKLRLAEKLKYEIVGNTEELYEILKSQVKQAALEALEEKTKEECQNQCGCVLK